MKDNMDIIWFLLVKRNEITQEQYRKLKRFLLISKIKFNEAKIHVFDKDYLEQ
jgi:hypothetical protein